MSISVVYSLRSIGCALLLSTFSFGVSAFHCTLNGGPLFSEGTRDVYITPNAEVGNNVNIVFDSRRQLMCSFESLSPGKDMIYLEPSTVLGPKLSSIYNARILSTGHNFQPNEVYYSLPLKSRIYFQSYDIKSYLKPWPMTLKVVLTPIGNAAEAIQIKAGDKLATFAIQKRYEGPNDPANPRDFFLHIFSDSDFGIPLGGCDVSSRNVNVTLGDYPSDTSYKDVNLSVKCGRKLSISYAISGKMQTETIFSNVAPSSPATGIGIELVRDNQPVPANKNILLGFVTDQYTSLGLKARYALNKEKLSAGNVQAVIGVNFTYN